MKRLIAILISLCVFAISPSEAAWTFVNTGGTGTSATGTSLTFTIAGVHVGDVIAINVKWEGGDTTVSCSDTASSYTDAFVGAHVTGTNGGSQTMCYTLSSGTSGTVTYTVTWGATRTFRDIGGIAYTPPSAAVLDGTGHLASATAATADSGNMTTTSTDGLAVGGYGETGGVPTTASAAINSVTRDQILAYGSASHSCIWSKSYSSGFTGSATVPLGSSTVYNAGIIAFKPSGAVATSGFNKLGRLERME